MMSKLTALVNGASMVLVSVWFIKGEHEDGAREELMEVLKLLESELGEKAYFGGDRFRYLDVSFFPYYLSIHQLENTVESRLGGEMEAKLPKLEGWTKSCMLRESVSSVLPDLNKLSDCIRPVRKQRLDEQA
ncbi:hypothetical protein MLD38_034215 [Melastoma candidum]|uniref:Uncharacterized protein n=1 Tax=Melastoma candidum TaxID=119954 RepID=A0ACB9M9C9_9MYRT|nr:hypothetical protein MLD38_034215 [Melastoma candidum]